jgi:hypothetical protein
MMIARTIGYHEKSPKITSIGTRKRSELRPPPRIQVAGLRLTTLREVVLGRSMAVMGVPFLIGAGFAESG